MKTFRFPLQKALELRATQLAMEEARFHRAAARVAAADGERQALETARAAAETEVRAAASVAGQELAALGAFQAHAQALGKTIAGRRAQCVEAMETGRAAMLEARRRLRLLERLKERRRAEWTAAASKEVEETAAESYLAQWRRAPVK
jgi:flagellar export protein FliJ